MQRPREGGNSPGRTLTGHTVGRKMRWELSGFPTNDSVDPFDSERTPPMNVTGTAPARVQGTGQGSPFRSHSPFIRPSPSAIPKGSLAFRIPSGVWIQVGYVLLDIFFVAMDAIVAFYLRFGRVARGGFLSAAHWRLPFNPAFRPYGAILLVYVALIVLFCQSQHLYRTLRERTAAGESLAVAWAVTCATLVLTAFIFVSGTRIFSRFVVLFSGSLNFITLISWRLARRHLVIRRVTEGVGARNALIVGCGRVGQALAGFLEDNQVLGYKVRGFVDSNHTGDPGVLGRVDDLDRVIRAEFIDEVFITIPSERELVKRIAEDARNRGLDVKVIPELYDGIGWKAPIHYLGDFPVMNLHSRPIPIVGLFFKRLLDVTVATAAGIFLSPLLIVLAIAIRHDSPGSVLYRSARVGKKGRKFTCYKFRTMVENADALKEELRRHNERDGPFFKIADDPRVTRVGRFLRKYSLDELPQLWNVIRGDMSLVGPRPHPLDDYERYDLEHLRRLDVKPGITGLWQVTSRRDPSFEKNMSLDLAYIEDWHFGRDLKILLKTVPEILRASGS
jgi:exopolysaccharide biosynthesis polyprenyl glycosylphosphotransferase